MMIVYKSTRVLAKLGCEVKIFPLKYLIPMSLMFRGLCTSRVIYLVGLYIDSRESALGLADKALKSC